jgi:predicted dehydrogenase
MEVDMQPVSVLLVGAGSRGSAFARFLGDNPDLGRLVGVAEPRQLYRERLAHEHNLALENVQAGWEELAARPRFAEAVIIATPDRAHAGPAQVFAEKGYAILLEKPMATTPEDCRSIVAAVRRYGNLFAVFHDFRYMNYTRQLKQIIDSGALGEIISIQHLEPVGYWHYAHSYVRGNWRNENESSFMLLAKSCHDIDWLRYLIGQRCVQVSSSGSLSHFKKSRKPAQAGEALRCLECAYEAECPYSAARFYLGRLREGNFGWPLDVVTQTFSEEAVREALRRGPYGRCVYECDTDVVDHQVVNLLYENGVTASFSKTGCSEFADRKTLVFGTRGEIRGDIANIEVYDFLSGERRSIDATPPETQKGGHWDGDANVLKAFLAAIASGDTRGILSGAEETLETHLTVFAAEQSRREGRTISL